MLVYTIACCYLVFATSHWQSMVLRILVRFTAFSLPGQFPPRSELANSTMTNLQPGTFNPGSEMARELATDKTYSYIYAPQKFQGTKWPGSERTREQIGPGAKRLGTIGSTRSRLFDIGSFILGQQPCTELAVEEEKMQCVCKSSETPNSHSICDHLHNKYSPQNSMNIGLNSDHPVFIVFCWWIIPSAKGPALLISMVMLFRVKPTVFSRHGSATP